MRKILSLLLLTMMLGVMTTQDALAQCAMNQIAPTAPQGPSGNPRGPSPRHNFSFGQYYIDAAEMAAAGFNINDSLGYISFEITANPSAVTGKVRIYLQNSTDVSYSKGTVLDSSGTKVVDNTITLPSVVGFYNIPFNRANFNYTGGGVYVNFVWTMCGTPTNTTTTTGFSNTATNSSMFALSTTSCLENFAGLVRTGPNINRPKTRFGLKDVSVDVKTDLIYTLGSVAVPYTQGHVIRARIVNTGLTALTNIPVTLTIGGANTFSNIKTIASLAGCGGSTVVSFDAFTSTNLGTNNIQISATVAGDLNSGNDSKSMTQDVSPTVVGYKYAGGLVSGGVGFNGATGSFVALFRSPNANGNPDTINEVKVDFSNNGVPYRLGIYANINGRPGALLYTDAADRVSTTTGTAFLAVPDIIVSDSFFVGIRQTGTTNIGFSYNGENPVRIGSFFFVSPLTSEGTPASWVDFNGNPFRLNIEVQFATPVPPNCAVSFSPVNNTGGFCNGPVLTWASGGGGPTGYDVYLNSDQAKVASLDPSALVSANQAGLNYVTGSLAPGDYYWSIVPKNAIGSSAGCSVIKFTVAAPATITSTTGATRCGSGVVTLSATASSGTIAWYDSTGGVLLATGASYMPFVNNSTEFYVRASSGIAPRNVGAINKDISLTTTSSTSTTSNIAFNILTAGVTINSVDIYPTAALSTPFTIVVVLGTATIASYSGVVSTNTGKQTVPLNFSLGTANGYQMKFTQNGGALRNTGGDNFPYTSAGVISLTANSEAGFYNFFYNWIVSGGCAGPLTKVDVIVTPAPPITLSAVSTNLCAGSSTGLSVTSSNAGYTYVWTPTNRVSPSTGSNTSASPLIGTMFYVTANDATSGCGNQDSVMITVTTIPKPTALSSKAIVCANDTFSLFGTASIILSEKFNGATNTWIKINNSTNGIAANAAWTLRPNNYIYGVTFKSPDSSQFYLSNSDAQGNGSQTNTILQSPGFSTVGYTAASLNFAHHFDQFAAGEFGNVEISTNNGSSWIVLANYITDQGTPAAFATPTINLNAYLGLNNVMIRFRYSAAWGVYWAVDNVEITGTPGAFNWSWASSPGGFTSSTQDNAGVTQTATTQYMTTITDPTSLCTKTSDAVTVTVLNAPTSSITSNNPACIGYTTTLTSTATSQGQPITRQWYKNGLAISGATASTYVIQTTFASDNGTYECYVTNACSTTVSNTVTVNVVNCGCQAPTIITQNAAGSGQLSISWPSLTGLANLYVIQYRRKGTTTFSNDTVASPTTTKLITGLNIGTVYQVRMRTLCFADTSDWSQKTYNMLSGGVVACPDVVNSSVSVTAVNSNSITYSWTAVPGAQKYLIKWRNAGVGVEMRDSVVGNTFTLTGLFNSTMYYFQVLTQCSGDVQSLNWTFTAQRTTAVSINNGSQSRTSQSMSNVNIFPNPAKNILNVNLTSLEGESMLQIVSVDGRVVKTVNMISGSTNEINISEIANGVYFARISNKNETTNIRFVKAD